MEIEFDHVFVCAAQGAPEASRLVQMGFIEGSPNVHPGQGTANRRFFFRNAMVELLWVSDFREAMTEDSRKTHLWERWSKRASGASPFARRVGPSFPSSAASVLARAWEYKPAYLPPELCMYIRQAPIDEPMWVHLDFVDREYRVQSFMEHPNGAADISGLRLTTPIMLRFDPAWVLLENRVVILGEGRDNLLEIEVDHQRNEKTLDLRPALPVVFRL